MERSWYTSLVAGRRAREDTVSSSSQGYTALVQEALSFSFPTISPRHDIIGNLADPAPFNLVHIITGMRRCGKTFFTFQLIRRLLDKGVPRRHVFYFNFADDRLRPISSNMLNDIVEEYWRLVPEARTEGAYLFLDEVQEADGWQGFCQRIAEHERVTLTITGSSSKLSADEIASTFRGRSMEHRMFPLSFREYCEFHGIETPEPDALQRAGEVAPQKRTELEAAFDRYLVEGGFPGVQTLDRGQRILLLQSYMRDVVARDVVERYRRIDIDLANQVALFCLRNTGCELSINNLVESLRAVGYRTSWETINGAIRLFRQAHLLELLPEYSVSLSPDSTATNKVYAADPGYGVRRLPGKPARYWQTLGNSGARRTLAPACIQQNRCIDLIYRATNKEEGGLFGRRCPRHRSVRAYPGHGRHVGREDEEPRDGLPRRGDARDAPAHGNHRHPAGRWRRRERLWNGVHSAGMEVGASPLKLGRPSPPTGPVIPPARPPRPQSQGTAHT